MPGARIVTSLAVNEPYLLAGIMEGAWRISLPEALVAKIRNLDGFGLSLRVGWRCPGSNAIPIRFVLEKDEYANITVCAMSRRRVAVPVNHRLSAGAHEILWHTAGLASGVYGIRISMATHNTYERITVSR